MNLAEKIAELNTLNEKYKQSKNKSYDEQISAHDKMVMFITDNELVDDILIMYQDLATWKMKYNLLLSAPSCCNV